MDEIKKDSTSAKRKYLDLLLKLAILEMAIN